jgi:hypothetical protein
MEIANRVGPHEADMFFIRTAVHLGRFELEQRNAQLQTENALFKSALERIAAFDDPTDDYSRTCINIAREALKK